jgi:UDP-GlcNAc:undecaprenyl-phosphate GlcNAc-1-phosphate transferase
MAAVVSFATTPLYAGLARRARLIVAPRADRWHARPTPLLGGAAIVLAALIVLSAASAPTQALYALVIAGGAAFALGLLDDFRGLAPTTKLAGQVLIASGLAFAGIQVEIVPFAPVAFFITVIWVVALMNALNLLDNMDGLAAGIAVISGVALGITALPERPEIAIAAAAVAGAALGFLPHNSSPARQFMGDAGSMFLGCMLAAVALLHTASAATNLGLAVIGPLAVLALPIFDTALVTTLRRLAGRPIVQGGRDHVSHRLAALGLSDRSAVLILYGLAAALALVGIVADAIVSLVAPLFILVAIGFVIFGVFLAEIDVYGRSRAPAAADDISPVWRALRIYGRFGAEIAMDVALLITAYYLAYIVRFEGAPESVWLYLFVPSLPIVIGIQLATLVVMGVYRTLWRYFSVSDVAAMVRAVVAGTAGAALAVLVAYRFEGYSRAVFLLDALIAAALLIGSRSLLVWLRHWASGRPRVGERRVLIVGANDAGVLALRLLSRAPDTAHRAVGFIDDDPGKRYRKVGGVPIVGTTPEIDSVVRRLRVDLVVIAANDGAQRDSLRAACERIGVEHRELTVTV